MNQLKTFAKYGCAAVLVLTACACGERDPLMDMEPSRIKEMDKTVRANMRAAQIGAEHYAADHGSVNYPTTIDDVYRSYFPGGTEGRIPSQVGPVNPFTSVNEFPLLGKDMGKSPEEMRHLPRFAIKRGVIEYIPLDGGRSYAIVGGAHDDKCLVDDLNPDQNLVFSNR